ncbi:MAG: carboxypeptidase regulatory-like domain-containing protein, partial [Magnetococcales bacterium]|nr:carboxypeptidase regulatory-like domain-containing protein [Magnetococcales bacterium]
GTVTGLTEGVPLWIEAYSEKSKSWGGTEVIGTSESATGSIDFSIAGLTSAKDFQVSFWAEGLRSGPYGGDPGGDPTGPVEWNRATRIDTTNGDVDGINILLSSGGKLTIQIEGFTESEAGIEVEANAWSEDLGVGEWTMGTVSETGELTLVINGLDPEGKDYKVHVAAWDDQFKSGHYQAPKTGESSIGRLVNWDLATPVNMAQNQTIQVTISSGATITGTISGLPDGKKAFVSAWSESTWAWGGVDVEGTGSDIEYTIRGLEFANDYRVDIQGGPKSGIQGGFYDGTGTALTHWDRAYLVKVTQSAASATEIDLPLSTGKSIQGTITGLSEGEEGFVEAWSDATYSWSGVRIEGSGDGTDSYTLEGVDTATDFDVTLFIPGRPPQHENDVDTSSGTGAENVDFDLSNAQSGDISGTVAGLDVSERVWIDAWSPESDSWGGIGALSDQTGSVTYTLEGLAPATDYIIAVWSEQGGFFYSSSGATPLFEGATGVTVTNDTVTENINIDISTSAVSTHTLSGTVSGLSDSSVESTVVEIYAWSDNGGYAWTSRSGDGTYTLDGLIGGDDANYVVEVYADGFATQHTRDGIALTDGVVDSSGGVTTLWTTGWKDVGTILINQDITGLDVTLSSGYSVTGTISGLSELSDIQVSAWSTTDNSGGGDRADSTGAFSIPNLFPGTYEVSVWTQEGSASTSVTVVDGDVAITEALVISTPESQVTGTMTMGSVTHGIVEVSTDDGYVTSIATSSDSGGVFTITGLAQGTYTLQAYDGDGDRPSKQGSAVSVTLTSDSDQQSGISVGE